jgi:hypothetical protein
MKLAHIIKTTRNTMHSSLALAVLALTSAMAAPLDYPQGPSNPNTTNTPPDAAGGITAEQLLAIMPTSSTCATISPSTTECRTATQAAPFVSKAFTDYGITSTPEQAALLAIMAFESVEFKFNTNQAGYVGQGTRNMQSGNFNLQYAQAIPELREKLAATGTGDLNAVRALVLLDEYSFASAAWFLTSQCSAEVRTQLQTGSQAGWEGYISSCVGTEPGPRVAYWQAAVKALA